MLRMILCDSEPLEVYALKEKLANLQCKCSVCQKHPASVSCRKDPKETNKEIQAEPLIDFLDQKFKNANTYNVDWLDNKVSCPGCYIAINLLKARETRVCKDEVTETKSGLSSCDKASGKCVKFIEKTTSTSSVIKPVLTDSYASPFENINNTNILNGIIKKRSYEHVSFSDNIRNDVAQDVQVFRGHCTCLQNFMDSIRSPLIN